MTFWKSKKTIIIGLVMIFAFASVGLIILPQLFDPCKSSDTSCYQNPVLDLGEDNIGDPAVVFYNDTYYLVGTAPGHIYEGQIKMWSSEDLVTWKEEGVIYQATLNEGDWNKIMFWAAEIFIDGDDFYLSYAASPDWVLQNHRIGIAHSNSIKGPYIDLKSEPTFDLGVETIDQHIFKYNNIHYMYYTNHHEVDSICMVQLNEYLNDTVGEHVKLFERSSDEIVAEAPWLYSKDGNYYILYSANSGNTVDYRVGYYHSASPLGPFTKGKYILSKSKDVFGPGHCSIVSSPDGKEDFIIYQSKKDSEDNWNRYIAIDRISITWNGKLVVDGPSNTYQPYPSTEF